MGGGEGGGGGGGGGGGAELRGLTDRGSASLWVRIFIAIFNQRPDFFMLMLPFAIKNKSKGNSQEYKEYNNDTFEDSPQHKERS